MDRSQTKANDAFGANTTMKIPQKMLPAIRRAVKRILAKPLILRYLKTSENYNHHHHHHCSL
jgi:hypothetical protein